MTTREDAVRLAKAANKLHIEDDEFFAFAERLIELAQAEQREKDSKLCETSGKGHPVCCPSCAYAIRSQGG